MTESFDRNVLTESFLFGPTFLNLGVGGGALGLGHWALVGLGPWGWALGVGACGWSPEPGCVGVGWGAGAGWGWGWGCGLGLCWALGSGLALELGWRSSGFETEIGKLKMERLCPVLWGWAGHDLEVVSRPEKRFPCFEFGGPGLGCGLAGAGLVGQSSSGGGWGAGGGWGLRAVGGHVEAAGGRWGRWGLLGGAAGGCWRAAWGSAGRGSGALLGSAGLCWALGLELGWRWAGWLGLWGCGALLGLWAGLGAGLGSSGFETEIGLLENGEVVSCAVGLGWARSSGFETEIGLLENGEVVSRPEKRFPDGQQQQAISIYFFLERL